jgi:hypothetical protein
MREKLLKGDFCYLQSCECVIKIFVFSSVLAERRLTSRRITFEVRRLIERYKDINVAD